MDQSEKSYEERLAEHKAQVEYRKELAENLYQITLRYDRAVLAVAGGGTAMLVTTNATAFFEKISILLFIGTIISILLSLYLGAIAHRKVIDDIGKSTVNNSDLSESSSTSYAGLLSKYLSVLSLGFIITGLCMIGYAYVPTFCGLPS